MLSFTEKYYFNRKQSNRNIFLQYHYYLTSIYCFYNIDVCIVFVRSMSSIFSLPLRTSPGAYSRVASTSCNSSVHNSPLPPGARRRRTATQHIIKIYQNLLRARILDPSKYIHTPIRKTVFNDKRHALLMGTKRFKGTDVLVKKCFVTFLYYLS